MLVQVDDKEDYGEVHWISVAPREGRLYTVVFTMRDDETPRTISLRRATNTEIERYETQGHK